jgi:nickel-dependent lactate racemase
VARSLPWGKTGQIELNIPPDWKVILDHRAASRPAIQDVKSAVSQALVQPIAGPRLVDLACGAKKAAIIIDDVSRPTPAHLMAPVVLEELLNSGLKADQIVVIFGIGTHRPMTEAEMQLKAGNEVCTRVKCRNHDCRDHSELKFFGKTSSGTPVYFNRTVADADLRILIGTIEPHPQAGFGGGLKNLLPGVAGAESIGHNHLILPSPASWNMIGTLPEENPMRQDIEQAAAMLAGKNFIVNTILGPDLKPVALVSGDAIEAHRKGVQISRELYSYNLPRKMDAAIVSSFPMDVDLRQGVKGVANVPGAVKKGGVIICFLKCERGLEDIKPPNLSMPLGPVRLLLKALGCRGIYALTKRLPKKIPIETRFIFNFGLQVLKDNHVLIFSPQLAKETNGKLGHLLFDDQAKLFNAAQKFLGPNPETCIVAEGGVSFPVIEA